MGSDKQQFYSIVAEKGGEIFENLSYFALGRSGSEMREPRADELFPVPYGAMLFFLPGRLPLGKHRKKGAVDVISSSGHVACAAAIIPPPGYTRTLLPAYKMKSKEYLPFFAYAMGAFREGSLYMAAVPTEISPRWDPSQYDGIDLGKRTGKKIKKSPGNRLLAHLSHCATEYHCYNAQNIFYERWEGGIPISPGCNASCAGCISVKREGALKSPQKRIPFVPKVEEIVEIAVEHLGAGEAIISFGQGCEGEPLLQAELLERSIREIRSREKRGTININTNGSKPESIERLIDAGLDSIRVSLNSCIEESYNRYYKPEGYGFRQVRETLRIATSRGIFTSINLLVMPGVTDSEEELHSLLKLLGEFRVPLVQMRNLNIDPDLYFEKMPAPRGKSKGIVAMMETLKRELPWIRLGSFSFPIRA